MNSPGPRTMGELFLLNGCLFLFERIMHILGTNGELQHSSLIEELSSFPCYCPADPNLKLDNQGPARLSLGGDHAARDDRESHAYHFCDA